MTNVHNKISISFHRVPLKMIKHSAHLEGTKEKFFFLQLLFFSSLVVAVSFLWQGNKGFNLWDEGFLWYGVQRVLLGEVPIRDFMSYDPGRYYWSAALMSLWGDNGIIALRMSMAVFQVMGLTLGLWLVTSSGKKQKWLYLVISAMILISWMYPRHKLFDISLSIFLLGSLCALVKKTSNLRFFLTGVCVGLVAVFGRNHGVYGVAGSLGVLVWYSINRQGKPSTLQGFLYWSSGVTCGFLPILGMLAFVPGFAGSFWESIRFLFEMKSTNIPLPIPWPWRVDFGIISLSGAIRGVLVGLFFIGTIVFGVLLLSWVIWCKVRGKQVAPVLVAAACLSFPYTHYAFSRADVSHLAQGIFPLLIGCLALFSAQPAKIKWPCVLLLGLASLQVLLVVQPGWQCFVSRPWVSVEINEHKLWVPPETADDISLLRRLGAQYAPNDQSFLVTPFWPGAYALLKRKSPMWEIYALFPRKIDFEQDEIKRIQRAAPGFALVMDVLLDGRNELRFHNTHPLIDQYIQDNFERVSDASHPMYQIYRAKKKI